MNPFSIRLTGELTELRPLIEADREALFTAASDPLIWEQHPERNRYQRQVFDPYFDSLLKLHAPLAILDRKSGRLIGTSSYYEDRPEDSSIIIGYTFIERAYWGNTYNRELKRLMLDHAFQLVRTVYFQVGADNLRSQAAIKKLGAVECGELVRTALDGQQIRTLRYRLTRA